MIKNPFIKSAPEIKRRKNPSEQYGALSTDELIESIKKTARSPSRNDLDLQLDFFLKRYEKRKKSLEISVNHADRLRKELDSINHDLEQRIQEEVKLRKENHKMYEQQAKMASMGEMMDAVAHQWKQPLNALSMMSDILRGDFESGSVDQAYINELTDDIQVQIEHMVTTLQEFRTFFRPNKEAKSFGIKRCVQSVMLLVNDEFLKNKISITIKSSKEILIHGIENEFKHLILNIINNAKDAFNEKDIKERRIDISFYQEDSHINIEIEDNAGGIPPEFLHDIFKPEFTTKTEGKGTGIGLYMSMQIAQKLGGSLSVTNTEHGARFLLEIVLNNSSLE
jgi:C4-dicarboxylate-specific signal transduction histidine kinase